MIPKGRVKAMAHLLEDINASFPVRNSSEQKKRFREYVTGLFPGAHAEKNGAHENIVLGDTEKAGMIFCAHYDTPRRSLFPNLMLPANRVLHFLYMIATLLPLLAAAIGFGFWIGTLASRGAGITARLSVLLGFLTVYYGLYFLIFMGPANKTNCNDNTSGTAAVLELARRMGTDGPYAFVLFDNEEKGKKGSKAFAKDHPEIKEGTPVINLDCVGNGGTFLVSVSGEMSKMPLYEAMRSAFEKNGTPARFYVGKQASMNSDHKSFHVSAGICACKTARGRIFYTPDIHTFRDTTAKTENIDALADALSVLRPA